MRTLAEIVSRAEAIRILVLLDLKARYRGTSLGFFWSLLNPLLLAATYTLIFSVFMRSQVEGYPAFVLSGLLPWLAFSSALLAGCSSLLERGEWVKNAAFPGELLPLVAVCSQFLHLALGLLCLIPVLALLGAPALSWRLLWLAPVALLHLLLAQGMALALACLSVLYRDVIYIFSNLLTLWFFLTPIVYPAEQIPDAARRWLFLNPAALAASAYQDVLYRGRLPSLDALALLGVAALLALAVGLSLFDRLKGRLAEAL